MNNALTLTQTAIAPDVSGVKSGTYEFTPELFMSLRTTLRRYKHRRSSKMPNYSVRTIGGHRVKHVIPLGTHCLPANILRGANLRMGALPFDWVHTTPGMIRYCLETDFSDFLPKLGEDGHTTFRDRFGVKDMFLHKNPQDPEDRNYYARGIERHRRLMKSKSGKLFVMISRPSNPIGWHFGDLVDLLNRLTPNAELLAIQLLPQRDNGESVGLELSQERNGSRLYDFRPVSDESALGYFPDVLDELMILRLIYQYHLHPVALP